MHTDKDGSSIHSEKAKWDHKGIRKLDAVTVELKYAIFYRNIATDDIMGETFKNASGKVLVELRPGVMSTDASLIREGDECELSFYYGHRQAEHSSLMGPVLHSRTAWW